MLSFLKRDKSNSSDEPAGSSGGWLSRLREGLSATRGKLGGQLSALLGRHTEIDESLYEELETLLLSCDIGVASTEYLLEQARSRAARERISEPAELKRVLKEALVDLLAPIAKPLLISGAKPYVLLMTGVNGSGKTTSIGKLAKFYQAQGLKLMLAAGDTFRAAAVEQLKTWGERNDVPVIAQEKGDPAAVVFDAVHTVEKVGTRC